MAGPMGRPRLVRSLAAGAEDAADWRNSAQTEFTSG
jgi:hypothetical protein